jgi:predicted transcriptional regulator
LNNGKNLLEEDMLHLEFDITEEEKKILTNTLEKYLSELRMEIADTDAEDFRDKLKREKRFIYRFLEKLEEFN